MAGNIIETTDASFQSDVIESDVPVIVDFWAPWCGPCRQIAPVLEELANEYGEKVKIVKVNVDNNRGVASAFGIQGIPTLIAVKGGQVVNRTVGAAGKPALKKFIDDLV